MKLSLNVLFQGLFRQKYNKNDRSPFSFKRCNGPILPVLVLITRVIYRSTLQFSVARNIVYKSNTREKTGQLESVEHQEQYHIKFVETLHYLKRRGRKAFVESLFLRSQSASQSNGFMHAFAYIFFSFR